MFVEQMLDKPEQLNLLVAELVEEDVTKSMYAAHYPDKPTVTTEGKVSMVCKQVREELEKQDKSELKVVTLLPVLGTLVREGGNGMEEALARIRTVRGRKIHSVCCKSHQFSCCQVIVVSWFLLYSCT